MAVLGSTSLIGCTDDNDDEDGDDSVTPPLATALSSPRAALSLPLDYPLDHPGLHPIWAAAQEHNLCVIHHSLAWGYPGYRDMWGNPFIGRCGSHPWAAMRAVASFIGGVGTPAACSSRLVIDLSTLRSIARASL